MKTEKEIKELLDTWKKLKDMLVNEGDAVSLIVSNQSDYFISTLEWVLE